MLEKLERLFRMMDSGSGLCPKFADHKSDDPRGRAVGESNRHPNDFGGYKYGMEGANASTTSIHSNTPDLGNKGSFGCTFAQGC